MSLHSIKSFLFLRFFAYFKQIIDKKNAFLDNNDNLVNVKLMVQLIRQLIDPNFEENDFQNTKL